MRNNLEPKTINMIKKSPLIRALKAVASEYNDNSHRLDMSKCHLCLLYRDRSMYDCGRCPMRMAFKACGRRQCAPIECWTTSGNMRKAATDHLNKLEATKEFFYKTIAVVRRMTVKELNEPSAFRFLIEIDRKTAEKYGILREVGPWEE